MRGVSPRFLPGFSPVSPPAEVQYLSMTATFREEDTIGWRCMNCGYFHRGDALYEQPPEACEDCGAVRVGEIEKYTTPMDPPVNLPPRFPPRR